MPLLLNIAVTHLLARKRQTLVSLMGIILGVAFFLAVSSLMRGSEKDFIRRMVDNAPHITVRDEYRVATAQPVDVLYPDGAITLKGVKPRTERRGIRNYKEKISLLAGIEGMQLAAVLSGEALVSFAGKDMGVTLNGAVPDTLRGVSTIERYMEEGSLDALNADPNGIIVGAILAEKMNLKLGTRVSVASSGGQTRVMKVVGLFRTGNRGYDQGQVYVLLKKAQALLDRPNTANRFIIKLDNPNRAPTVAAAIEGRIGYLAESWQEASADIMNTLAIRNMIMMAVVSAILIVAAFGIYNIISTVVMEKTRDIAIMKSMGFRAADMRNIFVIQGLTTGVFGCIVGLGLGSLMMYGLSFIKMKFPGTTIPVNMPIDWSWDQYLIASIFALAASVFAAWLPARKAARLRPVEILRGAV